MPENELKDKIIARLLQRNLELKRAQQAASMVQQLMGAANEVALMLINDFGMTNKEIAELLIAADKK